MDGIFRHSGEGWDDVVSAGPNLFGPLPLMAE